MKLTATIAILIACCLLAATFEVEGGDPNTKHDKKKDKKNGKRIELAEGGDDGGTSVREKFWGFIGKGKKKEKKEKKEKEKEEKEKREKEKKEKKEKEKNEKKELDKNEKEKKEKEKKNKKRSSESVINLDAVDRQSVGIKEAVKVRYSVPASINSEIETGDEHIANTGAAANSVNEVSKVDVIYAEIGAKPRAISEASRQKPEEEYSYLPAASRSGSRGIIQQDAGEPLVSSSAADWPELEESDRLKKTAFSRPPGPKRRRPRKGVDEGSMGAEREAFFEVGNFYKPFSAEPDRGADAYRDDKTLPTAPEPPPRRRLSERRSVVDTSEAVYLDLDEALGGGSANPQPTSATLSPNSSRNSSWLDVSEPPSRKSSVSSSRKSSTSQSKAPSISSSRKSSSSRVSSLDAIDGDDAEGQQQTVDESPKRISAFQEELLLKIEEMTNRIKQKELDAAASETSGSSEEEEEDNDDHKNGLPREEPSSSSLQIGDLDLQKWEKLRPYMRRRTFSKGSVTKRMVCGEKPEPHRGGSCRQRRSRLDPGRKSSMESVATSRNPSFLVDDNDVYEERISELQRSRKSSMGSMERPTGGSYEDRLARLEQGRKSSMKLLEDNNSKPKDSKEDDKKPQNFKKKPKNKDKYYKDIARGNKQKKPRKGAKGNEEDEEQSDSAYHYGSGVNYSRGPADHDQQQQIWL